MSFLIPLGIVLFAIIYFVGIYNKLVSLRNRFKNAFSQIDVQLTRRYDLIPNLIETAKAYMKHERETLENVIKARNQAVNATKKASDNPDDSKAILAMAGAEGLLNGAMTKFMALAENYPDLKANQTMQQMMEELTSTENKVAFSRQAFNDSVMTYNTYREQFPNSFIANSYQFHEAQLFEVEEPEARKAVKVSFD
ncbi:MAG: hypothetical protein COW84_03210 [Gammaproteobacteria bacterium CG22_combo_CG10-13_8_21_14_all_40_8]|nr:MAG: hypothetical protein COW84_03210 [Gammaproteobacteria bacterium CG22_combo_CG10-13_8_21_14_all_40_8]